MSRACRQSDRTDEVLVGTLGRQLGLFSPFTILVPFQPLYLPGQSMTASDVEQECSLARLLLSSALVFKPLLSICTCSWQEDSYLALVSPSAASALLAMSPKWPIQGGEELLLGSTTLAGTSGQLSLVGLVSSFTCSSVIFADTSEAMVQTSLTPTGRGAFHSGLNWLLLL